MKKVTIIAAFIGCVTTTQALVVTNGVLANTSVPADPIAAKCWTNAIGDWTAIGSRVFCGATRVTPPKEIVYLGITNKVVKIVNVPANPSVRFLIVEKPIPSWSPVAQTTPVGINNEFPVIVVADGAGCASIDGVNCDTDGVTWKWGKDVVKRWGTAIGVRVGPGVFVNWKMGTASGAINDYGGGTFNELGEYIGPITAVNNPTTKTSWNASVFVAPYISLVAAYMEPPAAE
jgi:hypothetical protein